MRRFCSQRGRALQLTPAIAAQDYQEQKQAQQQQQEQQ
jgi:hypothetical protein